MTQSFSELPCNTEVYFIALKQSRKIIVIKLLNRYQLLPKLFTTNEQKYFLACLVDFIGGHIQLCRVVT